MFDLFVKVILCIDVLYSTFFPQPILKPQFSLVNPLTAGGGGGECSQYMKYASALSRPPQSKTAYKGKVLFSD